MLLVLLIIVLTVAILVVSSGVLRIILGLPFLFFFPGYTLVMALYPRNGTLGGTERLTLSVRISAAVTSLIGLLLNYTPWGIRVYPLVIALAAFVLITSLIACYRWRRLADVERFNISFSLGWPRG